jgi:hypothetical protein
VAAEGYEASRGVQGAVETIGDCRERLPVGEFDVEWCRAAYRVLRVMHKELWEVSHERDESSDEVNYDKPKLTR